MQRVEKTLQDAGIKLSSVASEVLGVSARRMLDALISGTHDPDVLAELAKGALRKKIPALREALEGRFTGHHALLIGQMLAQIDFLDETIATLSARVEELTRPFSREIELLDTIPGVDKRAAEMLLAEIGPDMSRFPTEHHLASWGGMCPGQRESGAKKHSAATRKGSKWLRGTLTECSKAVVRTKGTYLSARYHRIKSRRGHAKATVATGHKILTAAYHVLNQDVPYHELGEEFFYRRDTENTDRYRRRLVKQLERLGHQVTLQPHPRGRLTQPLPHPGGIFDSGKAGWSADRDAPHPTLATRPKRDRDDWRTDGRRHFPFVAHMEERLSRRASRKLCRRLLCKCNSYSGCSERVTVSLRCQGRGHRSGS